MRPQLTALGKRWLVARCVQPTPRELGASALIFAPHPDDETLGCGGTMIRKREAGATVRVAFMTDGERSHAGPPLSARSLGALRRREAVAATAELGLPESHLHFLGYRDGALAEQRAHAVARVAALAARCQPEEVYVPHALDGPADHAATTAIVLSALRRARLRVRLYEYPVWLWCGYPWVGLGRAGERRRRLDHGWRTRGAFLRELRCAVPVGDVLPRKERALAQYRSQTTRLFGRADWRTLRDVARGEWLAHLLGDEELFYRRDHDAREG